MNPDLTPIFTEYAQLVAFKAQAEIDGLLDASFAADYRPCAASGAMIGDRETQGVCYPCSQGNRARGPIYGASLAGHTPAPGDALRAVEAVWITPVDACAECARRNERIDALLDQNDSLVAQLATLSTQYAALVRAGKRGAEG
jgi:hypothetical protein